VYLIQLAYAVDFTQWKWRADRRGSM